MWWDDSTNKQDITSMKMRNRLDEALLIEYDDNKRLHSARKSRRRTTREEWESSLFWRHVVSDKEDPDIEAKSRLKRWTLRVSFVHLLIQSLSQDIWQEHIQGLSSRSRPGQWVRAIHYFRHKISWKGKDDRLKGWRALLTAIRVQSWFGH